MSISIKQQIIAKHLDQDIIEYQLISANGFQVNFLNYGGIITGIYTPDSQGKLDNVVLSRTEFDPENPGHWGATTGRIAGRIAGAKFELEGQIYQLHDNKLGNNLHGGPGGIDKQIWQVTLLADGAELSHFSPDGTARFPANVSFKVRYQITQENRLTISYSATCDRTTIINLTNHSYFDLSAGRNALGMELEVPAEQFGEIDATGCVTGKLSSVSGTPFDFRKRKTLGQDIFANHSQLELANQGYDHPFVLDNTLPIRLSDPLSGRTLEITTNEPCCVVYSANFTTPKHIAVCLETQRMPNAINWSEFRESVIFSPDKPYHSQTHWQFGVK